MTLIGLVVLLVICGVVLWLINTYVPLAPPFKTVINVIVVLALCLYLLQAFGLFHSGIRLK